MDFQNVAKTSDNFWPKPQEEDELPKPKSKLGYGVSNKVLKKSKITRKHSFYSIQSQYLHRERSAIPTIQNPKISDEGGGGPTLPSRPCQ